VKTGNAAVAVELPMTPDARLERAKRLLAENISELVAATLAKNVYVEEWVDQSNSPLGRRRHLDLVRAGKLKGSREGRRVLVRKVDIDAFIARNQIIRVDDAADEEREVARVIATLGRRSAT